MTPLKNTDKHFSDYLPPALVKDWRQCLRSRSALLIFILLELAGWMLFFSYASDAGGNAASLRYKMEDLGSGPLWDLGLFALVFAIPYRAGSTVAADTKERSSNFLMLTPLSARRIVGGTWSSTALMVLLAALCALPLLFMRRLAMGASASMELLASATAFDGAGFAMDTLALGWFVLGGWVMAAFYMFSVGLPRVLRLGLLLSCISVTVDLMYCPDALERIFCLKGAEMAWLPPVALYVVDALLLIVLFLELARRHYAAPAENCSRSVRLLAFIPLLLFALQLGLGYLGIPVVATSQPYFVCFYLLSALLADALLPTYSIPPHAYRLWRGLPGWFQKPGLAPSALCLALAAPLLALPEFATMAEKYWGTSRFLPEMTELAVRYLNVGFSLLLWLLLTDCLCSRSNTRRPVVFGLVALVVSFMMVCIFLPMVDFGGWVLACLPLAGLHVYAIGLFGEPLAEGMPFD